MAGQLLGSCLRWYTFVPYSSIYNISAMPCLPLVPDRE